MQNICIPPTTKYESMHRDATLVHSIDIVFFDNGIVGTCRVYQTWNISRNHKTGIMN